MTLQDIFLRRNVKDLWPLKAALHRPLDARRVDDASKAA